MWDSFVSYADGVTAPLPAAALGITSNSPELKQPALIKERLIAVAKRDLSKRMGERYEEVVINCLTCLDQDIADFGFEDQDGVLVGVKYIDKVYQLYSFYGKLVLTMSLDTYEAERNSSIKLFNGLT